MNEFIVALYGIMSMIGVFIYLPQIKLYMNNYEAREGISLISWSMWTLSMVVTAVYMFQINNDYLATSFYICGAVCCFWVTFYGLQYRINGNNSN